MGLAIVHQDYRRDIEQELRFADGETFTGKQEEDRWALRGAVRITPACDGWLLGGRTESRGAEGTAPLVGAGLAWHPLRTPDLALTLHGGFLTAQDITYRREAVRIGDAVLPAETRTESTWEWGGGVRLSGNLAGPGRLRWVPYSGMLITGLSGDGRESYRFPAEAALPPEQRTGRDGGVDLEADGMIGMQFGLQILWADRCMIGVDLLVMDREVMTVGLGWRW